MTTATLNPALHLFRAKNLSATALAREFHVTRSTIYQSLNGQGSRLVRVKIAKKLGVKPSELWQTNDKSTLIHDDALFQINEEVLNGLQ